MPLIQTALQSGSLELCAYMLLQRALIRQTAIIISNVAGYITEQYCIFLCKQWRESINKQWLQENSMQAKTCDDANLHNELYFTPSLHNIHYIWLVAQHLSKLFIVINSAAQTVPPAIFVIVATVVMITYFINQAALGQLQEVNDKLRRYESVFQTKYKWLFSQLSDTAGLNLGSQVNETCNSLNKELFNRDYEFNKRNRIRQFFSEINKVIEYVFITGFPLYLCYRGISEPALAILLIS